MDPDGRITVRVGTSVAGYVTEDAEHPGLWIVEDDGGLFMGRMQSREAAEAFLAAWLDADEQDWS